MGQLGPGLTGGALVCVLGGLGDVGEASLGHPRAVLRHPVPHTGQGHGRPLRLARVRRETIAEDTAYRGCLENVTTTWCRPLPGCVQRRPDSGPEGTRTLAAGCLVGGAPRRALQHAWHEFNVVLSAKRLRDPVTP